MRGIVYTVTINPAWNSATFGTNNFYNFGKLSFVYAQGNPTPFNGPTHWFEHLQGVIFCDQVGAIGFDYALKPGVQITYEWLLDPINGQYGLQIAGQVISALLGKLR